MRTSFKVFALILGSFLLLSSCGRKAVVKSDSAIPYAKRLLIAVGDLQNRSGFKEYNSLMEPLTGNFIYELHNTQCFRLVERDRLKSVLEETKLGMTGLTDPKYTKQIGKILGVDAILFANLATVTYTSNSRSIGISQTESDIYDVSVDSRLVAVETGEILAASKYTVSSWNSKTTGFMSGGNKTDSRELVKWGMEQSVQYLAKELAAQVFTNIYLAQTTN